MREFRAYLEKLLDGRLKRGSIATSLAWEIAHEADLMYAEYHANKMKDLFIHEIDEWGD